MPAPYDPRLASNPAEHWSATNRLAFCEIHNKRILYQLWYDLAGRNEWRVVPEITHDQLLNGELP